MSSLLSCLPLSFVVVIVTWTSLAPGFSTICHLFCQLTPLLLYMSFLPHGPLSKFPLCLLHKHVKILLCAHCLYTVYRYIPCQVLTHLCLHTLHTNTHCTATQSTQTLTDEDDDQYSTPLALPGLESSALKQRHPLLNPELLAKLQKLAKRQSTSQAQRETIATLLTLYLQQMSPATSPVESEREDEQQRGSMAIASRYWEKR